MRLKLIAPLHSQMWLPLFKLKTQNVWTQLGNLKTFDDWDGGDIVYTTIS